MSASMRLFSEAEERISLLASMTERTKAFHVREIIDRGLEDMEDYYMAADILKRVREGR